MIEMPTLCLMRQCKSSRGTHNLFKEFPTNKFVNGNGKEV